MLQKYAAPAEIRRASGNPARQHNLLRHQYRCFGVEIVDKVRIQHFSDVLCVWAYVSQVRIDELKQNFGAQIEMDYHFVQVFGHAHQKLEAQWGQRGGAAAYGKHVKQVVQKFEHVSVHPEIWQRDTPRSSLPAHLFLCALKLLDPQQPGPDGRSTLERAAWAVREAFFSDLVDISQHHELMAIAGKLDLPTARIQAILDSGAAHAVLSEDIAAARDQSVRSSPTLLFNEGRQVLTGNVGYRVIEANVRELLRQPSDDQSSWC
jgi:predicted DsbA family dithiol-disulfide isomerase